MTKARIAMLAFTSVIMIALEGSPAVAQLAGDGVCDRRGASSWWTVRSHRKNPATFPTSLVKITVSKFERCYIRRSRATRLDFTFKEDPRPFNLTGQRKIAASRGTG
jgi:hypothetical protein